jgi:hypothetical protein
MQYHSTQSDRRKGLSEGFLASMKLAKESDVREVLVYTPMKTFLAHGTELYVAMKKYLPEQSIKALINKKILNLGELTIHWETTGTPGKFAHNGSFIAFCPALSLPDVKTIIAKRTTIHSVFAPFRPEELDGYLRLYPSSQPLWL